MLLDIGLKCYAVPSPPHTTSLILRSRPQTYFFQFLDAVFLKDLLSDYLEFFMIHLSNIRTLEGLLPFHNY